MFESIEALRSNIVSKGNVDTRYASRMLHRIPDMPTVPDRARYLVEKSRDKVVLDIGSTGPISQSIRQVAKKYYGIDRVPGEERIVVDLDHRPDQMPKLDDVEVVIASEVLEHLSNPGYFLMALKEHYPDRTVYITVPNAGAYHVRDGCENVNAEHVCWYSAHTLKTLLERYGYRIQEARWYHGEPYKAEGIIMVVK